MFWERIDLAECIIFKEINRIPLIRGMRVGYEASFYKKIVGHTKIRLFDGAKAHTPHPLTPWYS